MTIEDESEATSSSTDEKSGTKDQPKEAAKGGAAGIPNPGKMSFAVYFPRTLHFSLEYVM